MTSAALAYSMPSTITVESDLLGALSVDPASIITFPKGLLGFPECRSFVLLQSERKHVYWLQSVDYASLAFLMVDPFVFFEGYTVDLAITDFNVAIAADEVHVLSIVTLPSSPDQQPTANLQGPIVVHMSSRVGRQIVIADGKFGIREPFAI